VACGSPGPSLPILVTMFAKTGALRNEEAIPVVVMPAMFLFILLVILLTKVPKAGVGLVVAVVVVGVLSLLVFATTSYWGSARVSEVSNSYDAQPTMPSSSNGRGTPRARQRPAACPRIVPSRPGLA